MIPTDRFDRQLTVLLEELAQPRTPDYFDDLLGQAARTRQRPAWTFLERWLPMVDIARQPASARPVPWRQIAVLALIGLLVAVSLAVFIGSQQRLPAPFGVARNGLVAYAVNGDIHTADPVTGTSAAVVTGPETDLRPVFSLDGTRIVFERKASDERGPGQLVVARADGADLKPVTPEPIDGIIEYAFSPDGRAILFETRAGGIHIADVEGRSVRTLSVGSLVASQAAYRPPDGAEIVFVGRKTGREPSGLFVVRQDGTNLRTLIEPSTYVVEGPRWSADGAQIAYTTWAVDTSVVKARIHVISSDGQADRILRPVADTDLEGLPNLWSNDGTRMLAAGCYAPPANPTSCDSAGTVDGALSVVTVDGKRPDVRIEALESVPGMDFARYLWAPDDAWILSIPIDANGRPLPGSVRSDPATGRSEPVPWTDPGDPSWQRLAP